MLIGSLDAHAVVNHKHSTYCPVVLEGGLTCRCCFVLQGTRLLCQLIRSLFILRYRELGLFLSLRFRIAGWSLLDRTYHPLLSRLKLIIEVFHAHSAIFQIPSRVPTQSSAWQVWYSAIPLSTQVEYQPILAMLLYVKPFIYYKALKYVYQPSPQDYTQKEFFRGV